jgi:PAS domain S-box-containing protein
LSMGSRMSFVFPKTVDRNTLDTVATTLTATTLDDFLEAALCQLLNVDHVKAAEVQLFNQNKKLVSVASAGTTMVGGKAKQEVIAQSWLLNSTVEHTRRRIKSARLTPVFAVPLMETQGLLGFLNIRLDKLRTVEKHELNHYYLFGVQIANMIKEIMLMRQINELNDQLRMVMSDNREIQQQVTTLSKELYAISAVTTKINQSMDFEKSLRRAMATTRKFFGAAIVLVFTKNGDDSKLQLSAVDSDGKRAEAALLRKIKRKYLNALLSCGRPIVKDSIFSTPSTGPAITQTDEPDTIVGVPLKSNDSIIGAMILMHRSRAPFDQAGLRLLSGMANIMAMSIDNMNLFKQSEQKKREAEFLVRSIARFNESLDLKKTLMSVTKKGVEFVGPGCKVFLFSETPVPMIEAEFVERRGKETIAVKIYKKISPKEIKSLYESMKSQKAPVLIKNINRSKRFEYDIKRVLSKLNVHSLIGVPLKIRKRILGLLLLILEKGDRSFSSHDLSFAEALGNAASLSIENARAHSASLEMSEFLEKKILEKTSQIHQIQQRQKIRVENRKDIIFRINPRNRFIFVNKAMETLTGYSREALYQGDVRADAVVAPDDRERVKECFDRVLTGGEPIVKGFEYRQLNQKGEEHLISLTIYPEKDKRGRIIGVEGVGEDITEKRRLASELAKAKDLALLGEFSSAVAHQIRNPLGNILMGSHLLQKELGVGVPSKANGDLNYLPTSYAKTDQTALHGIFGDFVEGIHNLNHVVTELLEYTKTLKLSRSSQRIEVILRETLNRFDSRLRRQGIRVEERFESGLPELYVDAVLLGQVFQNIIHNAIQAMPGGGDLFLFSGLYAQSPGHAIISINDSGPGIPRSEAEKVFHPFYTKKDQGTGLGLSLAHRIVEAHHGSMWVCQEPCHHFVTKPVEQIIGVRKPSSNGTRIHITLPIDTG